MKKIKSRSKRIKIRKIIQILFIIPIISMVLLATNNVKAGTNDSTLEKNTVNGIYAVAPLPDKTHLYNLNMYRVNNRVSYCIEIGKPITTTIYNSTSIASEQLNLTKLSQSDMLTIKEYMYFGYGYPGHTDQKYYMAAQELIWEHLNRIDITWTNVLDINGPKIDIESYKNEIKKLIRSYSYPCSFESVINCKVGDKLVLNDKYETLIHYNITSAGNQTAKLDNNTLTINISNNYIGKDEIKIARKNNYDYNSTLYYFDNSQSLLSSGNIGNVFKSITLNITGETLTTNLIDKDTQTNTPSGQASLEGAVYEVYDKDNNLVTTFTTDENGINTIENLYHDIYYIKQKKASKGYKLDEKIYEINLTSENNKLTLTEEVIKSTIEINKLYEIGDNYERESGIKFNIYDNKKNLYTTITTTKYGPDNVTLPYGNYTIVQDNTTYGYEKVKNINLTINENTNPTIRYDLVDKKILNKIHITTKNKQTKEQILQKNIKYKIKDKENDKYLVYIDNDNNKIEEFSTNDSGELIIPIKLPYGEYEISQINTPTNYLENKKPINVTINEKSKYSYINNQVLINVDFFNEPIVGKLIITTNKEEFKSENNNYTKEKTIRPNIEVELYYNEKKLNTYKTDKSGLLEIENLKLGKYCVKEKNNNNEKCVELTSNDNKIKIIEQEIELTEILKTTNVILHNEDETKTPIKGTTIELSKDDKLINTSITNELGIIKITNLPVGKYCFKETKISPEYLINNEKLCFEINDTSKDINLTIINKLNKDKTIKIPNTLKNSKDYIIIILICTFIIGVIYYQKNNKNSNN